MHFKVDYGWVASQKAMRAKEVGGPETLALTASCMSAPNGFFGNAEFLTEVATIRSMLQWHNGAEKDVGVAHRARTAVKSETGKLVRQIANSPLGIHVLKAYDDAAVMRRKLEIHMSKL